MNSLSAYQGRPRLLHLPKLQFFITQHDASERQRSFLIGLKQDKDSETGFSETMKIIFRTLVGLKLNSNEQNRENVILLIEILG